MGWRCELCDDILPIFQLSHLCPTCYKIRTIIKCYSATDILDSLESVFVVDYILKKPLTLYEPPVRESFCVKEQPTKEPTIEMLKFKDELEKKIVERFQEKNDTGINTRSNKKK